MKVRVLILLFLVFAKMENPLFAQINESDTAKLQLRLAVNGNRQRGNVDLATWRAKLEFLGTLGERWVFKTQNNALYQAFFGNKADADIFSRNYLYFNPKRLIYPYAIGFVSTNFRRKIDIRYFVGLGLTWQVIRRQGNVVKLSTNIVHEYSGFSGEDFNFPEYNGSRQIELWRNSIYLSGVHDIGGNRLRLYYEAFWQPELRRGPNYRAQVTGGIDFPLWKGLSANLSYLYSYENVVVENILQRDSILLFGLSYQMKKP
jgi:hypothetical protein